MLELGVPKGSLENSTIGLLCSAGFHVTTSGRLCFPVVDDPDVQCRLIRAQQRACDVLPRLAASTG